MAANEEKIEANDPLLRPSERLAFTDAEAEIEHLRRELFIFKTKALIVDDIKTQNEML